MKSLRTQTGQWLDSGCDPWSRSVGELVLLLPLLQHAAVLMQCSQWRAEFGSGRFLADRDAPLWIDLAAALPLPLRMAVNGQAGNDVAAATRMSAVAVLVSFSSTPRKCVATVAHLSTGSGTCPTDRCCCADQCFSYILVFPDQVQSDERAAPSYNMMASFRCKVIPAAGGAIILCGFCAPTYCVQEQYTVVLGRRALLLRPPLGPTGSGSTVAGGGPDLTGSDHAP